MLNSDFNFYTSSGFNRLSEKRIDAKWVKEKIFSNNSKIVLVKDLKLLVENSSRYKPVFLSMKDFKDSPEISTLIFLGEREGSTYFCVDAKVIKGSDSYLNFGEFLDLRAIANFMEKNDAAILAYARAMIYWHNNNKYCGICGSNTIIKDAGHKIICSNPHCSAEHFPRIDPAIIVIVSKDDKCLLAHQAKWPQGRYSTLAGYVEPGESLEQAVQREVFEETGIHVDNVSYHSSQPWPFPSAIMLGFKARAIDKNIFVDKKELEDAQWFSRNDIISKLKNKSLILSPKDSISFRLIQSWFDEDSNLNLEEIVLSLK
jgi:NAD+ diphosphatase